MLFWRLFDVIYENVYVFNMYIMFLIFLLKYVSSILYILYEKVCLMKFNNKKSYLYFGFDRLVEGCLLRKVIFVDGLKIK